MKTALIVALAAAALTTTLACKRSASAVDGGGQGTSTKLGSTQRAPSIPIGKLPQGVTPLSYELSLRLFPEEARFSGVVRITIELARATRVVWLHGRDLEVAAVTFTPAGRAPLQGTYQQVDPSGVAKVELRGEVAAGRGTLELRYSAPWNKALRGLYKVVEEKRAYVFTQFEPDAARIAFPSFDEPRFKTPFDVTVTVPTGDVAIGNTRALSEEKRGEERVVRFARTEKLPTYLLALAVGPLDVEPAVDVPPNAVRKTPLPLRGVTARGRGKQVKFALGIAAQMLALIESYFGIPYPFDKLDLIAVPDFASGAMENAGAITFREVLLLIDEKTAPADQVRTSAMVIGHELAHQWFGDFVTMPWWDDIWLNEAFSTWLAYETVERWNKEHGAELVFAVRRFGAMSADSLASARRIRQPIESSHDIRNAFDAITYSKGAAVIGMFERFMGREAFRAGLSRYLSRFRFGSATSDDFLAALFEGGKPLGPAFRTFLDQPGLPFFEVVPVCKEGAAEPAKVRLRQERYLPLGSPAAKTGLWQVPMCLRYGARGPGGTLSDRVHCALVVKAEEEIALPDSAGCPLWVHPNGGGAGYYRFALTGAGYQGLRAVATTLSAPERIAVADSLRAGFDAGRIDTSDFVTAAAWLAASPERTVATHPMWFFRYCRDALLPAPLHPAMRVIAGKLYRPVLERVERALADRPAAATGPGEFPAHAWKKEGKDELRLYKKDVLGFLASVARDAKVRRDLARRARLYLGGSGVAAKVTPSAIDPELVRTALTVAAQDGDQKFFEDLVARLEAKPSAVLRAQLLFAIARVTKPQLSRAALALVLDPRVRSNEVLQLLSGQLAETETRADAFAFLKNKFDAILAKLPATQTGYLPIAASGFCSEERAAEVDVFFTPRAEKLNGGPRNVKSAVERIRLCAALVRAQGAKARAFFEQGPQR